MKPAPLVTDLDGGHPLTSRDPETRLKGVPHHKSPPTPPPPDAPLMTRNDLAAILRTTPRQISNMIARGQIPAPVRVAGLGLRWRRSEIDAWLAIQ